MLDKIDIMKLNELPIEQVASALGLSVSHHKALCPFHNDSNPSLTFNRGKNRYKCYVCDAHGGVIDLVMRYLNKPFLEACKWLSEEHSLPVTLIPARLQPEISHHPNNSSSVTTRCTTPACSPRASPNVVTSTVWIDCDGWCILLASNADIRRIRSASSSCDTLKRPIANFISQRKSVWLALLSITRST